MDKHAGGDSHLPSISVLPAVVSFLSFFFFSGATRLRGSIVE